MNTSLPGFTAEISLRTTNTRYRAVLNNLDATRASVMPQGCGFPKNVGCATAVALCGAACATGVGVPACVACFASIGAGSCIDCL